MMECKEALAATNGDMDAAVEYLRKLGNKVQAGRADRATGFGRVAVFADLAGGRGAIVELLCESAPVAQSAEIKQFAGEIAQQAAEGGAFADPEELWQRPSPSQQGMTLGQVKDDLFGRIREVFKIGRAVRCDSPCGGYAHHDGSCGALVEVSGGNAEAAKDVAMHIAAQRPLAVSREELDPGVVERERELQMQMARQEGKPENILAKMVDGRMKTFFAERCLLDQPFVKEASKTVGKLADEAQMKILRFTRWDLGR